MNNCKSRFVVLLHLGLQWHSKPQVVINWSQCVGRGVWRGDLHDVPNFSFPTRNREMVPVENREKNHSHHQREPLRIPVASEKSRIFFTSLDSPPTDDNNNNSLRVCSVRKEGGRTMERVCWHSSVVWLLWCDFWRSCCYTQSTQMDRTNLIFEDMYSMTWFLTWPVNRFENGRTTCQLTDDLYGWAYNKIHWIQWINKIANFYRSST